jgi:hypothetical protein
MKIFSELEDGDEITLDGRNVDFMDHDIFLAIEDFVKDSVNKNIKVNLLDITRTKLRFGKDNEVLRLD